MKKAKDEKFESCVQQVKAKQGTEKVNPWAVCHASLGKSYRQMKKAELGMKEKPAIEPAEPQNLLQATKRPEGNKIAETMGQVKEVNVLGQAQKKNVGGCMLKSGQSLMSLRKEELKGIQEHPKYKEIHQIVEQKQHGKVGGHHIDLTTAHAMKQIADKLSPEKAMKFLNLETPKMANITWKLFSKK